MQKGKYTPQLKPELITQLYHVARKFEMPMTKILNLIVATALEELEAINDPDDWTLCEPIRPEDPAGTGEKSKVYH